LRSALQGKGYAKTVHLQSSGITTLIPSQNTVKQEDEELRRVLFTNDHQVRDYNFFYLIPASNIDLYHFAHFKRV
jgi:hypothetical protein